MLEIEKARLCGYTTEFQFNNGFLVLNDLPLYPIATVTKRPFPCLKSKIILYRIETPCGVKGYVKLPLEQEEVI